MSRRPVLEACARFFAALTARIDAAGPRRRETEPRAAAREVPDRRMPGDAVDGYGYELRAERERTERRLPDTRHRELEDVLEEILDELRDRRALERRRDASGGRRR